MGRMSVAFLVLLVFLFVCSCTQGQLNFSTGWGKRGLGSGTPSLSSGDPNNCKASVDNLMIIYKLIQNEAQKLIECEKFSK
uniref:Adipokinetic hormone n=1 Tax=Carabus violaceus TaxID=41075 RepID=A0A7U3RBK8_CARVO|nr:adipokinetic hormone [Carabus violaceus]